MADNNEFERLLAVVAQLNGQLETMRGILNDLSGRQAAQNSSPLRNMVAGMEADVKRLELLRDRAANVAFKSLSDGTINRLQSSNPLGLPKEAFAAPAEKQIDSSGRGYGPVARQLDRSQETVASLEKAGREAVMKEIDRVQEEVLRGAERAAARAAARTAASDARLKAIIDRLVPQFDGATTDGVSTTVHHPTGRNFYQADMSFGAREQGGFENNPWSQYKSKKEDPYYDFRNPSPDPFDAFTGVGKGGKRNAAAEAAAKAEEELVKSLRQRIGSEARYKTALDLAIKQGFSLDDLKKVTTKGTGGIEQLRFQKKDATTDGISEELDVFNTPAGKSTAGLSNQFRTFGQGVVRDIGELTKWSLALAAVYGPLNKIKELTQTMIENQSRLAEATVSVNSSLLDQSDIFNIAATAANAAGESIGGVIDAFTQAYRATGGSGTQQERLVTANKLLTDSLVLSKLSTLDQASAIDTLSAALRQSGDSLGGSNIALQNGTILLDKWVRVTKIANVDLASLATGFAVLGDSAEAAGIDADHLNGIIATIAETGISTGKETANIARALVGNFQSDAAEKALNQIGISSKTATGEMRPLLDIMQQVSETNEQGLIGDFGGLTQKIGQGVRQGANTAKILTNFSRVDEVAAESARANGDAQAALDKQLATVSTSLTRLGNAFDKLAQTLGTDSGFLGIITSAIDGITGLVNGFDSLISLLGKATPALIAFGAASAFLRYQGLTGGIAGQIQQYGASLGRPEPESRIAGFSQFAKPNQPQAPGVESRGSKVGSFVGTNLLGTNWTSGAAQGLALALIPAITNATNKEDRFGGTKAIADATGGVVGGILGSLAGPGGSLVGATIGISIAEAFVNAVTADREIYNYAKGPQVVSNTAAGPVTDPEQRLKDAEIQLYKDIGGGSELLGRATTGPATGIQKIVDQLNDAIKSGDTEEQQKILDSGYYHGGTNTQRDLLNRAGIDDTLIEEARGSRKTDKNGDIEYKSLEFKPENIILNNSAVRPETRAEFLAANTALTDTGKGEPGTFSAFSQQQAANKIKFAPLLDQIAANATKEVSDKRITGDLKGTEYARQTKSIAGFDETALQLYTGFGEEFIKIDKNVGSATDAFNVFKNVIVNGASESLGEVVALNTEIGDLVNELSNPALQGDKTFNLDGKDYTRDTATAKLEEDRTTAANITSSINTELIIRQILSKVPNIQGDINKPLTTPEETYVEKLTAQKSESFYKGTLGLTDSEYDSVLASFEDFAVPIKDAAEEFYKIVTSTDPQFRQAAMAQAAEENKLKSQKQDPFGIQQVDLSSKEGANLQQTVDYYSKYLSDNFKDKDGNDLYQQKPEDLGIIFNDYVTATLHGDNLAVKLALEKLVDINQKQLDGQYNIPEGATFWVPLTAAYYRNKGTDDAGGLDTSQLDSSAGNLDGSAVALTQAAYAITTSARDAFNVARLTVGNANAGSREGTAGHSREEFNYDRMLGGQGGEPEPIRGGRNSSFVLKDYLDSRIPGKSGGTGGGRGGGVSGNGESGASILETLFQQLKNIFTPMSGSPGFGGQGSLHGQPQASLRGVAGGGQASTNPAPVTKLDLKLSSSTVLNLDGRILANAMKNYLAQDLLRTDATQGTITKSYVI